MLRCIQTKHVAVIVPAFGLNVVLDQDRQRNGLNDSLDQEDWGEDMVHVSAHEWVSESACSLSILVNDLDIFFCPTSL